MAMDNHDPSLPQWMRSRLKAVQERPECGGTHMACRCFIEKIINLEAEVTELRKLKKQKDEGIFLEIKITTPTEEGPSVSIHWTDSPKNVAGKDFDAEDQAWTKICDGIHYLLSNLGPFPESGWDVKFTCPNPELIVEKDLTRKEYHDKKTEN